MSNVILGVAADEAVKFSPEDFANTITPFRPVRCTEKAKDKRDPVEGFVYYTTDSKKIYLGSNGKYLPMGGNSGIYYGTREISDEETEVTAITFYPYDLEGDMMPNVDDLILNIPDGCFYRVIGVLQINDTEYEVYTERLTIAGSGGGGGGSSSSNIAITDIDNTYSKFFTVDDEKMQIAFSCRSQNAVDNFVETVEYRIGSTIIHTDQTNYNFGNPISFDLKPYMQYLSTGVQTTLVVKATDAYGGTGIKNYYINLVELKLESETDKIVVVEDTDVPYSCKPIGGSRLDNRYVHIKIYREEDVNNIVYEQRVTIKSSGETISPPIQMSGCSHGVYVLEAVLCGTLPNADVIESNTLVHKIVYYDRAVNTPIIATHVPTYQIQQYEDLTVTYMVADKASVTAVSTARININDDEYITIDVTLNEISTWKKTFLTEGAYNLKFEYGALEKEIGRIIVVKYSGDVPVIDTNPTDVTLEMYLTSQGRSNAESNKDSWEWTTNKDVTYQTEFTNFLWGTTNGWLEDEEGTTALRLTNGAKIEIKDYQPFAIDATSRGLTIELDFRVSGVLDYSKPLIHCLSQRITAEGKRDIITGFQITGQKATLNSDIIKASLTEIEGSSDEDGNITNVNDLSLQAYSQYFKEGERVHLTYVIEALPSSVTSESFYYVFTYLNGILSGIGRMSASSATNHESFIQSTSYPAIFTVDSTYGDIDLYNVRFYRNGLSKRTVVNNWIADLTDIDQRIELYKENNILEDDGSISLKAIQDVSYQLKVPYVLFNGGCQMKKKKTEEISYASQDALNYALPVAKDDFKLMSMKMIDDYHPERNIDIPISLQSSKDTTPIDKFEQIELGTLYTPKRGVQVYGQGTSSMVYPVKNLRLRFIQEDDYPIVYSGSCPVEIVCFKADFMDSSSSHNTGTANLVYNLLQGMNLRTPPQEFMLQHGSKLSERYDITTAIRGYPIVCFYAEGDSEDYKFIGRYNFNIDKATPEPFGFLPMKVYTGRTTSNGRREVVVCGLATEEVEGMTVLPLDEAGNEIEKDLTQCWEMKNNIPNSPTKFLTLPEYTNFMESLTKQNNWLNYYEDRYPDEIVGDTEDGKDTSEATAAWFAVCNWLNSYQLFDSEGNYIDAPGEDAKIIEALTRGQDQLLLPQPLTDLSFEPVTDDKGVTIIPGDRDLEIALKSVTGAYSVENFEYVKANLEKLSGYLSVLGDKKTRFRNEFETHFNKDFCLFYYCLTMTLLMMDSRAKNMMIATWDQKIWYPIFYDMDSMLGINNTGFNKFNFQIEDAIVDKVFTGFDSVLWNNVRECFYSDICAFYSQMRQSGLDLNTLLSIYNEGSADAWNEALSTADAEYKYIRPFEEGYHNGKDDEDILPGKKNYLYAGQGPRSAHRAWWLQNRLAYLDSKYKPVNYKGVQDLTNDFQFRCYMGPQQQASNNLEEYNACIRLAPPVQQFEITALNDSYHSMLMGSTIYGPMQLKAGEVGLLGPDRASQEVESQIYNADLIASLGDLSDKYIGQITFPDVPTRWTELCLGRSERSHPGAWEGYYNQNIGTLDIGNSCPYLTYLNIAGIREIEPLKLGFCKRLKVVDATRSTVKDITFPTDSILEKLYLPRTVTKLNLENQPYLDTIEYDDTSDISSLILDRVPNFDSYNLVKQVFFNLSDIEKTYYLTSVNWLIDNDNDLTIQNGEVVGIKILDILGTNPKALPSKESAAASLSGTITIKSSAKVDEYTIYEKYSLMFPNVTIKYDESMEVTKAITIQFVNSDEEENALVYYEVYSNGAKTLDFLTNGKTLVGAALQTPVKAETAEYTYIFQHKWTTIDAEGNQIVLAENEEDVTAEVLNFNTYVPTIDSVFTPVFEASTRHYTVTIYDWDETKLLEETYPYGTEFANIANIPVFIYRDSSKLDVYDRYAFKGYINAIDFENKNPNPIILDLSTLTVNRNYILYAYYAVENVKKVASDLKYFRFDHTGPGNKLAIHIADDIIRSQIRGKITLPLEYEGEAIQTIGDFRNTFGITHVYFLEADGVESAYTDTINQIGGFGVPAEFAESSQLEAVYLPSSMRIIGQYCFAGCMKLKTVTLNNDIHTISDYAFANSYNKYGALELSELPQNLKQLGQHAFDCCNKITLDSGNLPDGLETLPDYVFNRCTSLTINIVGYDNVNSIKALGQNALYGVFLNRGFEVHVGSAIERIGAQAFGGYRATSTVYFQDDYDTIQNKSGGQTIMDATTPYVYGYTDGI